MDRPRFAGGTFVTSFPSIRILPDVVSSSPAINRSSVVLPQPVGPTKTTKDLSAISKLASGMMSLVSNDFFTCSSVMLPMMLFPLFHRAESQSAHELLLTEPAEDQNRRDRHGRSSRELRPEQAFGARIRRDEGRQWRRGRGREVQGPECLVPGEDDVQQQGRSDTRPRHRRQYIATLL